MIPFPKKKYKIIYADPPWEYNLFVKENLPPGKFGCTRYDTMSLDDICAMDVKQISEKDSILCIWVTYPCLPNVFKVIESWGFKFVTVLFTWVKRNKSGVGYFSGLGMYTKANAEICILARRGRGCRVINKKIQQIIDLPLTSHSKKPHEARIRIIQLFGDLPRIELFARTKIHGWDTWGNDEKLQLQPLENFNAF